MSNVKSYEKAFFNDLYFKLKSELTLVPSSSKEKEGTYFRENINFKKNQSLAIEIVPENKCQLKCKWCYIDQFSKKTEKNILQPDELEPIILQAAEKQENGCSLFGEIVFIGGEPTLNPHLPYYISRCLDLGLKPVVITNGIKLASLEYAKRIAQPNSTIVLHIPFMTDYEKYDKYAGASGYSVKVFKAIENLNLIRKEFGAETIEIVGDYVLNSDTLTYALEAYKFCRDNNIVPFFEYMRSSKDNKTCDYIKMKDADLVNLINQTIAYDTSIGKLHKSDSSKIATYYIPPAIGNPCTLTQTGIHIKNTKAGFGDVWSCCGQSISFGNVLEYSLKTVLENKKNYNIFHNQKDNVLGPCVKCFLFETAGCHAGCRGNALSTFNCAKASDPQCIFIKDSIKENPNYMAGNALDCLICEVTICDSNKATTTQV